MTQLRFIAGGFSFADDELVFHHQHGFGRVTGISGCNLILNLCHVGEVSGVVAANLRRNVDNEHALYVELATIDLGIARWFLDAMREGETAEGARDRLRAAARAATCGPMFETDRGKSA